MKGFLGALRQLRQYPTAVIGMIIIGLLLIVSIITPIVMPYSEAVRLWRGGEDVWRFYPRNAAPAWTNLFRSVDQAASVIINSAEGDVEPTIEQLSADTREARYSFEFDFPYDTFPPEVILFAAAKYQDKQPFVELTWITPDGREIRAGEFSAGANTSVRFDQDTRLQRRLERESGIENVSVIKGLFDDPNQEGLQVLQGTYRLDATALLFEPESDLDLAFVSYGQVHGLAGTDHLRRDLSVALLWGTPIAMAFGLLAALLTTVTTMGIAAFGVWIGGWVDSLIQRITEVNAIIPLLPILIMVGTLYSRSIWVTLGLVIILSIFGLQIKNYRAIFMQVKESPYIDAARAYGAGNMRIIFRYLIPRVLPLVIPAIVILVPSFVFLEASLAVLGLGDPFIPTWGKLINDANRQGALFNGYYYWILLPSILLMIAGLAFAMVGFALDRVFNPRLREI
jgi:peptide/nickel transport system permease protein